MVENVKVKGEKQRFDFYGHLGLRCQLSQSHLGEGVEGRRKHFVPPSQNCDGENAPQFLRLTHHS